MTHEALANHETDAAPTVRLGREEDCPRVAALHQGTISSGFLGQVGQGFLTRLYSAMVSCPGAVLIVASEDDADLVGFVSACENTRNFYRRFLWSAWLTTAWLLAPTLLSLSTIRKLTETTLYAFRRRARARGLPEAELLSMAVARSSQGRGLGADLFRALVEHLGQRGCRGFRIVAGASNEQTNAFYRKMGCELRDTIEVHRGERSNVYVYTMR